ncbi:MAG: NAD-dependent epimerase/dehydratase family protein [Solirubrobacterales bacterium]
MKNALVTGGAGFIGSTLARRLLADGWKVLIIDNLSTGSIENVPPSADFLQLDVSGDRFCESLPSGLFDAVFHLAAQSSGEISFDNPEYDCRTNCLSTLLLLEWCQKWKIERFIYTSSMSVYGNQENQPVDESFRPEPTSFYGVGKLASEKYLKIYSELGVHTTAFRLMNVYGPGQNLKNLRQGMVSIYMAYLLKGEEILVKGSPDRYRDLIYVDDVVEALLSALDKPATYGQVYNVGTGVKTTVKDLINAEILSFGHDPLTYPVRYAGNTPGDMFGIYADISALREATGWVPRVSLARGLELMVQWAKKVQAQ